MTAAAVVVLTVTTVTLAAAITHINSCLTRGCWRPGRWDKDLSSWGLCARCAEAERVVEALARSTRSG